MASQDGNERMSMAGTPRSMATAHKPITFVLTDGIEMNETIITSTLTSRSPTNQEMQVITGNANAEYGNVNGGEITVVTKGGTNRYHGSAYDYFQNNNMAATSWANSFAGLPSTPFTQDQFGATFGGPILRNKLFFFGDYLGFRYHSGGEGVATCRHRRHAYR